MAKTVADQQADQSKQQRSAAGECPVNADPRTHAPNRDATEGAHAHREHVVDADRQATHFRRRIKLTQGDRKSVVWGKSLSVRVDLGGGRISKKTKIRITSL